MEQAVYAKLKEYAVEYKEAMISFLQKLIQTPSISGEEKAVADLYMQEMEKLGYDEVFRDDMGNVVGLIKGNEEGPSIMYNSHMDHVSPGDVANWQGYNPYGAERDLCLVQNQDKTKEEETECIHGRAASDVKGGAAAQIYGGALLLKLRQEGYKLKGTFMFTGVVQEEPAEMIGMIHLIDKTFKEKNMDYDLMVSSEASSLKLYCGHRGRVEFLVTVYGRTSHGSAPWLGINAIYKAMPVIEKLRDELYPSLPKDEELGQSSISLNIIECSPGALSIVPDKCFLSIDRRTIPGETAESALLEIQKVLDEIAAADPEFRADVKVKTATEVSYTGVTYEARKDMAPWKIPTGHAFVESAKEALLGLGEEVKYGYWDFGTDASKTAGIDFKPTIGYSPMQEQYAHTPYDKVRTDFMERAMAGNAAIFLQTAEKGEDCLEKLSF
jgi:putative selenium metabolism hydrolase